MRPFTVMLFCFVNLLMLLFISIVNLAWMLWLPSSLEGPALTNQLLTGTVLLAIYLVLSKYTHDLWSLKHRSWKVVVVLEIFPLAYITRGMGLRIEFLIFSLLIYAWLLSLGKHMTRDPIADLRRIRIESEKGMGRN